MLERDVERYFINQIDLIGGETRKMQWVNRANAPDRFVMFNGPHLVELKAPNEMPRLGQVREFYRMKQLGCPVDVLDSKEMIDRWVRRLQR